VSQRPLSAIVLAAGQGKRMRAPGPKVLVRACGRTLVEHVLEALRPLGASPTVVVYGHGGNAVREALSGQEVRFAHQPEQRGTGHAVQCALPALQGCQGDLLVLCGDTPLLTTGVLEELLADHRRNDRALTVLSAELDSPGALGRVLRDDEGRLVAIREAADATDPERAVREINTGVMVIDLRHLPGALARLTADNAQGELYLTDLPAMLLSDGLPVGACPAEDDGAALGVNNPLELAEAVDRLRRRILGRALTAGVEMEDPETTRIDAGVEIGAGTRLEPFVHIGPDVRVGVGCRVGPHTSLREGVVVGDRASIGARVELRRCTLGEEVDVAGPARLVGAAIGRRVRIEPGVVTMGEERGRIVIGDKARVGAGAVLCAPLTIAEGAVVSAGSVLRRQARASEGGEEESC